HTRFSRDWSSDVCSSDLLIFMGISSSLVLGVPLGILVSDAFGWRVIFLGIAALSVGSMVLIARYIQPIPGGTAVPLTQQIKAVEIGRASCREREEPSAVG